MKKMFPNYSLLKSLFIFFVTTVFMYSSLFCADAFEAKVERFIATKVLWVTRLLGGLFMLGGFIGAGLNARREEKLRYVWETVAIGTLIFLGPEIINWIYSSFGTSTIEFLRS